MDWKQTIALGWPVLSVLFVFSIIVVAIFFQCLTALRQAERADLKEMREIFDLVEKRLALLGTIANAAPFVGLLGTVIGIIRAFRTISQASSAGGGLALVAGGISEALIATAAGLAVAIPASMLYNYFTYHSQRIARAAGE
jgi:biopolymer transport protein ExbB